MHILKISLLLLLSLGLTACFNENEEKRVVLGNVSLGDQLIDLKKARDSGAISSSEYRQMREGLIELIIDEDYAHDEDSDDDDDEDNEHKKKAKNRAEDTDEDEGFSWL